MALWVHGFIINIGYLHECLSFELQIWDKICYFVDLYRSPSQSQHSFPKSTSRQF